MHLQLFYLYQGKLEEVDIKIMPAERTIEILCYGDSNTYGTIPEWNTPKSTCNRYDKNTRWTALLSRELGSGYHIIEEGLPGRTTIYEDHQWPFSKCSVGLDYIDGILMTHAPLDLVILMLGTNDLHMLKAQTEETLGTGIEKIIDSIKMANHVGYANKSPKILLISPIWFIKPRGRIEVYDKFHGEIGIRLSHKFAEVYSNIANEKDCYFLDAAIYAMPSEADGVHLTPEGHKALSIEIGKKIKEIFS